MELKSVSRPGRVEVPMSPMIDIVFQLLIFFMLNLKMLAPEGDFHVRLPEPGREPSVQRDIPDIKVSLRSDRDGNLTQLAIGGTNLGHDEAAFERLNSEILKLIGRPGNPLTRDVEVELDADFECQYKYIVKAVSRCTGRYDPQTKQIARYIERIRFAPPHAPKT